MSDRTSSVEELRREWENCSQCPLWEDRKTTVFGEGPDDAQVMLIGEGPGESEDVQGRPFVGKSGKYLDHILKMADLDRDRFFVTNTVQCRATAEVEVDGRTRKKDRIPSRSEMAACRPRLDRLIYLIDPVVILAVGKASALSLTGSKSLTHAMKDIRIVRIQGEATTLDYPVLTIYHPSYLLRRANNKDLFQDTVDRIRHLKQVLDALNEIGRDRPWRENDEPEQSSRQHV